MGGLWHCYTHIKFYTLGFLGPLNNWNCTKYGFVTVLSQEVQVASWKFDHSRHSPDENVILKVYDSYENDIGLLFGFFMSRLVVSTPLKNINQWVPNHQPVSYWAFVWFHFHFHLLDQHVWLNLSAHCAHKLRAYLKAMAALREVPWR